jgi:hypothetical protein
MQQVTNLLSLALLVLLIGISSADAAKRVALVIGNDSYKTLPDLDNARKDADGIASKLRSLGWDVVLKKDLSRRQAYRQIATFESKLRDAEVGLVYYAGHGIQKDGKNYLIPSDAEIEVEEDLRSEAGICIEQLQNWPYVPEEVITDDYIRGFADGKRFVCEALAQYLQLTFPALADEQIKFVFEDVSMLNDSLNDNLNGPYMDLQLPEWFEWTPDGGGEPMPVDQDNVVSLAL